MNASSIQSCDELRQALPDEARALLDGMLCGQVPKVDSATLYFHLPEDRRGPFLLCLHHWNVTRDVLHECIRHFWKVDNRVIFQTPGFTLERGREMFREAQFPLPPEIPPVVKAWRGTSGRTVEEACQGLCWTLDRDAACWFATLYEDREPGNPIVVTASVPRERILFLDQDDGLHESEVVLDHINGCEIDCGGESEWRERAKQFIKRRKQAGL